MDEIAELITLTIRDFDAKREEISARVTAICKKYPLYQ